MKNTGFAVLLMIIEAALLYNVLCAKVCLCAVCRLL